MSIIERMDPFHTGYSMFSGYPRASDLAIPVWTSVQAYRPARGNMRLKALELQSREPARNS